MRERVAETVGELDVENAGQKMREREEMSRKRRRRRVEGGEMGGRKANDN